MARGIRILRCSRKHVMFAISKAAEIWRPFGIRRRRPSQVHLRGQSPSSDSRWACTQQVVSAIALAKDGVANDRGQSHVKARTASVRSGSWQPSSKTT